MLTSQITRTWLSCHLFCSKNVANFTNPVFEALCFREFRAMSYIDTFDNEFVGFLAGYPVYRPLVVNDFHDHEVGDFSCTPNDFVVGGGGGEHPGVVVKNPNGAVLYFFYEWLEEISNLEKSEIERLTSALPEYPGGEALHFCGWKVDHYHKFYQACSSASLVTPYNEERFCTLDQWLYTCFGELIFFSYPELAEKIITEQQELHKLITHPFLNNILVQPAGFKPTGGRIIDSSGKLQWGLSAWKINRRT